MVAINSLFINSRIIKSLCICVMIFTNKRFSYYYKVIDQCCLGQFGRKWLCLILVVLMQTMLSINLKSASGLNVPQRPGIMSDYSGVIRRGDGHIDTTALISRLQTANIKTYMYLIYGSTPANDWTDFCNEFMPAAQSAGIDVYVYLVPPTEGGPSAPYNTYNTSQDYVAWSQAIATQATYYSHLIGFVIDDFTVNLAYFTPLTLDSMMTAAHNICPRLSLQIIAYYPGLQSKFFTAYADHIDGVIFPYINLDSTADLNNQIISIKAMLNNVTDYYSISYPYSTFSAPGDYAGISKIVNIITNTSAYRISFYHWGDKTYTTQGYHFKRFLIDGVPVWSADVAASGSQCGKVDLDVTSYLAGKASATLSFQLYEQKGVGNYKVDVNFANLTGINVTVNDLSETSYSENNQAFSGAYTPYNPIHGTTSLPLTTMIYTTGTSWHSQPPTTAYIYQALNIAGSAVKSGNADGFTTYCLDKSSDTGADYLAAKTVFLNYKNIFYRIGYWKFDDGSGTSAKDSSIFAIGSNS